MIFTFRICPLWTPPPHRTYLEGTCGWSRRAAIMVSRSSVVIALALLGCSQALRPAARTTVTRPHLSMSRRQLATAATAAAVSSLPMPGGWRASAASNLKKKRALAPELVQILRVKESTFQETRLISSGKYKDLQRLNIKRAIGMMLDNSDVSGRESNPGNDNACILY